MSELGPHTRALLDRAREGMTPDAAALARVRAKVGTSVAAGMPIALKLVLALVAAGIAGGAIAVRASTSAPASEPAPPFAVSIAPEETAPLEVAQAAPEGSPPPPIARAPIAPTPVAPVIEAPPVRATLAREVELVDAAMADMRRGAYALALSTLATYADETGGRGQLSEDAAAIEVEARCRSGSPVAAAHLDAFDRAWPMSAQRAHLAEACR
jgi:hypothetical protein